MKKQRVEKEGFKEERRGKLFVKELLHWNRYDNNRQMPWKGEKNPYRIWLSEVMLQQTRVEQGLKYYQNFITAFPDIHGLAAAPEEKVYKLWEGLGYYSRCKNLIQTARYIAFDLKGQFPETYEGILALKGVGPYTAAAIGSFAYNHPYAVLDGNVFRVLSRIFDKEVPIDSTAGKKVFASLAQNILPQQAAGEYNQAIMDFGATICKPIPVCDDCFFKHDCLAYLTGKQQLLPVKEKTIKQKSRWLHYFIVQCGNEVLIQQRTGKDIWQHLHQFVLIETEKPMKEKVLQTLFEQQIGMEEYTLLAQWSEKQALSHQTIHFHFSHLRLKQKRKVEGYHWIKRGQLQGFAFPKTLQQAVKAHLI